MATIFECRPRVAAAHPPRPDHATVSGALAALDAAARRVAEVAADHPEARTRAANLLALHARRLAEPGAYRDPAGVSH
jgi:hypothetical protein